MSNPATQAAKGKVKPLRIDDELDVEIKRVAELIGLNDADTMRKALEQGLPVIEQLPQAVLQNSRLVDVASLSLQVPIELPSPERLEELYRAEARRVVAERDVWLSLDEAADYLRMSRRSMDRKRAQWGLPVAELDGVKIVLRADLDAIARAHLVNSGGLAGVLPFPSQGKPELQGAA